MVAVHRFDEAAIGPEPLAPRIAVVGELAFDARSAAALTEFTVHQVGDLAAVEELAAISTLGALVSDWRIGLVELASRLRVRLIVVAPELPDALVDAVGRGVDACCVADVAAAVGELRRLRALRATNALRHGITDVRMRCDGVDGVVRDLSNDGVAFEVANADIERLLPGRELDGLTLSRRGRTCLSGVRALVRHVEPLAVPGHYLVGCALKPRMPAAAPVATRVRDRALCAALMKAALTADIVIAPIDDDARDGAGELALVGGRVDVARGTLSAECERSLQLHDLVRGQFELAGRVYRFTTVVVAVDPLELKLPAVLEESQLRASPRYRPEPKDGITVEISSPLSDSPVLKAVIDLSSNGFSFALDGAHDLYPLGLSVDVSLRLPDGPLFCVAEVRTMVREGSRVRCGVELAGDAAVRLRLANFVMRSRFPGIDDGVGVEPAELFQFFRTTGFLPEAKEAVLAPVMDEMRASYGSLYAAPSPVFKAVVSRDEERALVGHVSGVRVYTHTWMSQHLAAKPSKHIAHLLNLGTAEYFGQNPDLEFFKIYFDKFNKWPARVFGGFARTLRDNAQSELRTYRHAVLSTAESIQAPPGIDVLEATTDDLAIVERYFVQREKGLLLRADDLTQRTLQLAELNRRFASLGLYRRRRVLLAMRRNVCLGFALAELSSPGLNLSEALSAFRIYVTDEGRANEDNVRLALMAAALPIYRNADRALVRCMFAPEEIEAYRRIGAPITEEEWMCWTCHRTMYPRFTDWVERLFAVLERRARRA